jgi:hypothetical protein
MLYAVDDVWGYFVRMRAYILPRPGSRKVHVVTPVECLLAQKTVGRNEKSRIQVVPLIPSYNVSSPVPLN